MATVQMTLKKVEMAHPRILSQRQVGAGREEVVNVGNTIKIAKYPPAPQRDPGQVQEQHNAPGFTMALAHYLNDLQLPELRLMRHELS